MTATSSIDLATRLHKEGALPPKWEAAFAAVDRGAFVPHRAWFDDENGIPRPIEYGTEEWTHAVYSDEPVVTQLDEGRVSWPEVSRVVTSSASQPSVVLRMLDALDAHPGHRVLEIGTGTGYNAALLGAHLGDENVTTIEVDPVLARQAGETLHRTGHRAVTVIVDDGATGHPAGAPYDRVIATAAVLAGQIPYTWISQTRIGGLILTPWGTSYRNGGLLQLNAQSDGTASGHVIGDSAFMRLRQHTTPFGHASRLADLAATDPSATQHSTRIPPAEIGEHPDATTAIGLHLPGIQRSIGIDDPDHREVLLYDVGTNSAAIAYITPEAEHAGSYSVRQYGPRKLWDDAETAWHWWIDAGRPHRTRFGATVTPDRQWSWVDQPDNIIHPMDWPGTKTTAHSPHDRW